ncbi:MAG: DUF3010 family protein [Granulosicoccaceae bacterium]
MRVCGIDIKANEIIVCILSLDRGLFESPEVRQRRINIANPDDPKQLRIFQKTVSKLMEDYKVDKIAIKGRPQKGKFAGAASGFKLEAALQLLETHRASLISAAVIKETQKHEPLPVDFRDTGLKAYQEQAFMAAYTLLVGPRHPPKTSAKEESDEAPGQASEIKKADNPARKAATKKQSPWQDKKTNPPAKPAKENPWGNRS